MQITYELTPKDFSEAYADHRDRKLLAKWSVRLFSVVIVILAATAVFAFVMKPFGAALSTAAPLLVLIAFYVVVLWLLPSWSMQRQFRQQPGAHGPRTLTLDALGAHWKWEGGTSDIEWKNYIRFVEGKNQILFYTSPAAFTLVPKRALLPEQLDAIRGLVQQYMKPGK